MPTPATGPATAPDDNQKPATEDELNQELNETLDFTPSDVTFEEALKMYTDARKYIDSGFRYRWDNYFKVYQGERVDPSYFGSITVNNREVHTIVETLVANIAGGLPSFHFIATNEEQNSDTEVLNGAMDYYMNCNNFDLKNQIWVRDMIIYGTGVLHMAWREGKAYIENIPLRDFFFDPTATDLVRTQTACRYAGFEYLASKDSLEATMVYDPDENGMVAKYDLTDVGDNPITNGDTLAMDKTFKDMFNGSTLDQADAVQRQVHMVLIYDIVSGKTMEIANMKKFAYYEDTTLMRKSESRAHPNPPMVDGRIINSTQKLDAIDPFLPFAIIRDYVDASLLLGEGEMAKIIGDSELLNDYEAMDADNAAYQNTPMYTIDPQFTDMASEIETIPGAVYPIPKGALSAMEIPQTGEGLEIKKTSIINRMRSGTAADEAVQGIGQDKGRTTATEVSSQLEQAQGRFTTKITNLAAGGYSQLGSVLFKMMCIFLTSDASIRMIAKSGVKFERFDAWDWNGEYEPQVKLDQQIKHKQLEVGMKNNQLFQSLDAAASITNAVEVLRFKVQHIDPNFSDEDFNKLLAPPAPPPQPDLRDYVQLDKLYPMVPVSTQMALLSLLKLPPDPALEAQKQTEMMREASAQADLANPATDTEGNPMVHSPAIDPHAQALMNAIPPVQPGDQNAPPPPNPVGRPVPDLSQFPKPFSS